MFNALICINNHVFSCLISMLSLGLTPLITRMLSFFLGICYLALEIPVFSLPSENKSEALFSLFKHKIKKVTQKVISGEAKINDGYLSVKEGNERWKAFKRIKNLITLEGYDDRKKVILSKIVASQ